MFEMPGCDDSSACNFMADATDNDGSCVYPPMGYTCDGGCDLAGGYLGITLEANDAYGDGWNGNLASVYFDGTLYDPLGVGFTYTLVDGASEVSEFCIDQTGLAGCLEIYVDGGSWQSEVSWSLYDSATGGAAFALAGGAPFAFASDNCAIPGCTDATACNFDGAATEDDGSCTYAAEGFDCDGNQLDCVGVGVPAATIEAWVGDGYCDDGSWGVDFQCEDFNYDDGDCGHCVDATACNYGEVAECTYSDGITACDGSCINDTDGDGVCDENEVAGCDD